MCPPSGVKTRMARAQLGDVPRGQGTLMAREEGNVSGTIKAKLETSSLTLALTLTFHHDRSAGGRALMEKCS